MIGLQEQCDSEIHGKCFMTTDMNHTIQTGDIQQCFSCVNIWLSKFITTLLGTNKILDAVDVFANGIIFSGDCLQQSSNGRDTNTYKKIIQLYCSDNKKENKLRRKYIRDEEQNIINEIQTHSTKNVNCTYKLIVYFQIKHNNDLSTVTTDELNNLVDKHKHDILYELRNGGGVVVSRDISVEGKVTRYVLVEFGDILGENERHDMDGVTITQLLSYQKIYQHDIKQYENDLGELRAEYNALLSEEREDDTDTVQEEVHKSFDSERDRLEKTITKLESDLKSLKDSHANLHSSFDNAKTKHDDYVHQHYNDANALRSRTHSQTKKIAELNTALDKCNTGLQRKTQELDDLDAAKLKIFLKLQRSKEDAEYLKNVLEEKTKEAEYYKSRRDAKTNELSVLRRQYDPNDSDKQEPPHEFQSLRDQISELEEKNQEQTDYLQQLMIDVPKKIATITTLYEESQEMVFQQVGIIDTLTKKVETLRLQHSKNSSEKNNLKNMQTQLKNANNILFEQKQQSEQLNDERNTLKDQLSELTTKTQSMEQKHENQILKNKNIHEKNTRMIVDELKLKIQTLNANVESQSTLIQTQKKYITESREKLQACEERFKTQTAANLLQNTIHKEQITTSNKAKLAYESQLSAIKQKLIFETTNNRDNTQLQQLLDTAHQELEHKRKEYRASLQKADGVHQQALWKLQSQKIQADKSDLNIQIKSVLKQQHTLKNDLQQCLEMKQQLQNEITQLQAQNSSCSSTLHTLRQTLEVMRTDLGVNADVSSSKFQMALANMHKEIVAYREYKTSGNMKKDRMRDIEKATLPLTLYKKELQQKLFNTQKRLQQTEADLVKTNERNQANTDKIANNSIKEHDQLKQVIEQCRHSKKQQLTELITVRKELKDLQIKHRNRWSRLPGFE
jgi:chromosome segregation ATPase